MKIDFAKDRRFLRLAISGWIVVLGAKADALAQSPSGPPAATEAAASSQAAPVALSYGVSDVLKLARAKVGEDTIIAYIESSRRAYPMSAAEIIYLRQEGVSDRALVAMMDPKRVAEAAKAAVPAVPTPTSYPAASTPQNTVTYAQPIVTYVPSTPVYVPSSTVYVPSPTYVDYGYYSYYPYYRYSPPRYSWSLGFGGSGYWGGYHTGIRPWSTVGIHAGRTGFQGGGAFRGGSPGFRGGVIRGGSAGFRGGGAVHSGGGRRR